MMHKNKLLNSISILFLLGLFAFPLKQYAQEVDEYGRDLEKLTLKKKGPNKDYYGHIYIGYGFVAGASEDSAKLVYGKSSAFSLGYLWKWRLAKWTEVGFSAGYNYQSYHLAQDSSKTVPNSELHKREKIQINSIELAPFLRIKLRNRYHSTGTFIDFGAYAGYVYRTKQQTQEKNVNPNSKSTRTVNLNLKYTEEYNYGAFARIGFNRFILYGRYRLSNLFTEECNFTELPNLEFGLKIGIHQ